MYYDFSEISVDDLTDLLEARGVVGSRRHLLLELFFVHHIRDYERPHTAKHFSDLLDIPEDEMRELLRAMVNENLVECASNLKTGAISDLSLSEEIIGSLRQKYVAQQTRAKAYRDAHRQPRPATDGLKRRTRNIFDGVCEICGDKAELGKDRYGKEMVVARIKKDQDATPENVTLTCSKCSSQHHGRDLPHDCRTTQMMEIAVERKMEFAPRTAVATPKPLKEVVLRGAFTMTTRNVPTDEADKS